MPLPDTFSSHLKVTTSSVRCIAGALPYSPPSSVMAHWRTAQECPYTLKPPRRLALTQSAPAFLRCPARASWAPAMRPGPIPSASALPAPLASCGSPTSAAVTAAHTVPAELQVIALRRIRHCRRRCIAHACTAKPANICHRTLHKSSYLHRLHSTALHNTAQYCTLIVVSQGIRTVLQSIAAAPLSIRHSNKTPPPQQKMASPGNCTSAAYQYSLYLHRPVLHQQSHPCKNCTSLHQHCIA